MHCDKCPESIFPELQGVDPVSLRVFHSFFRAIRLHRQLMFNLMSNIEAYPGQAGCLSIVNSHAGITQRDLARKLHVASSTVTVMVQKMEAAGIVSRKTDTDDQRLTRIYLTDTGRVLLDEMNDVLVQFINITFGKMSPEDRANFDRLLNMLCANIAEELDCIG
ncbi:MAG: winged helix-turn-helix transcriptional regulator [Firmicutes bacterium]|nr:winged helix-turn-helix transcriptional regulator [Bacillota bacterium]